MFDINFFRNTIEIKRNIISPKKQYESSEDLFNEFEGFRSKQPYIFNIETTNNCNMTCKMCPRTRFMNRKVKNINDDQFLTIIDQAKIHNNEEYSKFKKFIANEYGILEEERSENSYYFYVISKALTLHGYGEPLIDPNIVKRIQQCTDRHIPTYFSCVPANININKLIQLMEAGLGYIKFAMDALDDHNQKRIRGKNSNFQDSFDSIVELIEYKKAHPALQTKIVITMLSFSDSDEQKEVQNQFIELWKNYPVYAYVKSQDNKWYYSDNKNFKNRSHYQTQYCEFPWTSLSVMSNGTVVPCTQDYNAEMNMGNINEQRLEDIWNSEKYTEFRNNHITGNFPEGFKCHSRCDLPKIYERLIMK